MPHYENEVPESYGSQNMGLFDDSVNQINEKIDFMGNRISTLSSDFESRLHAMDGLIDIVQNGRKTSSKGRQTRTMKPKEPVPSPVKQPAPTMVTRKKSIPIQALNKVLRDE